MFETILVSNKSSLMDSILVYKSSILHSIFHCTSSWAGQTVHVGLEIEPKGLAFPSWKLNPPNSISVQPTPLKTTVKLTRIFFLFFLSFFLQVPSNVFFSSTNPKTHSPKTHEQIKSKSNQTHSPMCSSPPLEQRQETTCRWELATGFG